MRTLFLRAASEADMIAALSAVLPGLIQTDENGDQVIVRYTHRWAIDWGVPIVVTPAVIEGQTVVSPAVMDTRFHVNLRLIDDSLDPPAGLEVFPAPPQRVWAGEPTA